MGKNFTGKTNLRLFLTLGKPFSRKNGQNRGQHLTLKSVIFTLFWKIFKKIIFRPFEPKQTPYWAVFGPGNTNFDVKKRLEVPKTVNLSNLSRFEA